MGMEILDGRRFVFVVVAVHGGWFSGDITEVMCGLKEDDGCALGLEVWFFCVEEEMEADDL